MLYDFNNDKAWDISCSDCGHNRFWHSVHIKEDIYSDQGPCIALSQPNLCKCRGFNSFEGMIARITSSEEDENI